METIVIEKGWFWSAGKKWNWIDDGFAKCGVGIHKSTLQNYSELIVEVEGKKYHLNCQEAKEFINKYKSAMTMPHGSVIGVISRDLLERVEN